MALRTEPIDKWVRAYVDDVVVVDSREPLLFWEEVLPVPHYAFKRSDVRTDLLQRVGHRTTSRALFFLPRGSVSKWFDLTVGDRTIRHAAWVRDEPPIDDMLVLSWQPGVLDRWLEEDEEVGGHPRDPHKRVEVIASSRHVIVERDGVRLADSQAARTALRDRPPHPLLPPPRGRGLLGIGVDDQPEPLPLQGLRRRVLEHRRAP